MLLARYESRSFCFKAETKQKVNSLSLFLFYINWFTLAKNKSFCSLLFIGSIIAAYNIDGKIEENGSKRKMLSVTGGPDSLLGP